MQGLQVDVNPVLMTFTMQVMPFFGLFFLQAELTLNDCGTRKRAMQLAMQQGLLKEQQDGAPANQ